MGYSFKDYIAESTKYMYDDSELITEGKFKMQGKEYPSKKAAELALKKRGLSNQQLKKILDSGDWVLDDEEYDIKERSKDLHYENDVRHEKDEQDDNGEYLKDKIQTKHKYDSYAHEQDNEKTEDYYDRPIPKSLKARLKAHIAKAEKVEAEYKIHTDKWDSETKKTNKK